MEPTSKYHDKLKSIQAKFAEVEDQEIKLPWETCLINAVITMSDDIRRMAVLNDDVFTRLEKGYPVLNFLKICTGRTELVKYPAIKDVPALIENLEGRCHKLTFVQHGTLEVFQERCYDSLYTILSDLYDEVVSYI